MKAGATVLRNGRVPDTMVYLMGRYAGYGVCHTSLIRLSPEEHRSMSDRSRSEALLVLLCRISCWRRRLHYPHPRFGIRKELINCFQYSEYWK